MTNLNIVGIIWDNVSTQHNSIITKEQDGFGDTVLAERLRLY